MPRQQNRTAEQSLPSQQARTLPSRALKFTKSPSAQGRLAFADITINEDTFHLFNGLRICSFVILKPKEQGGLLRVYVPGHKLPSGQNFRHIQEDSGDLNDLQHAIRTAYTQKHGQADGDGSGDEEHLDEETVDEAEVPY